MPDARPDAAATISAWNVSESAFAEADSYLPGRDALEADAYLVSRGVRPLALVGHCPADPVIMLRVWTCLHRVRLACQVIPFIFPEGGDPGSAAFGYAAHGWVIDHLEWALSGQIPAVRKHEILGMLCGYSAPAIARHQESEGRQPKITDETGRNNAP